MQYLGTYGVAKDLYFTMVKAGSTDLAVTGDWTPATGDTKVSKDGGTVANTTNNPAVVAGTGSVLWKLQLTATEMQAVDVAVQIVDSATKAVEDNVLLVTTELGGNVESNKGIIVGEVDNATFTPTTSAFEAFRISPNATEETTADHYIGRNVLFTTGNLQGQMSDITDYALDNSKEKFTVTAMTEAPSDSDRFVVL